MTRHHDGFDLQTAVGQLLDILASERSVTLDISPVVPAAALESVLTALHREAQRRGMAVTIDPREGRVLCLSSLQR